MKVTVQQGQNIYDIAKMYYGSVDGLRYLIADNPTVITDIRQPLIPGTVLNITSAAVNPVVVRQLKSRDERIPLNEKTVFANDDAYTFGVWEDFSAFAGGSIRINCVKVMSNGDVWVGTDTDGVYVYDGTSWTRYGNGDGALASDSIRWFVELDGGTIIGASTGAGLAEFELASGDWVNNSTVASNGFPSDNVRWSSLYSGGFFVATDGGVLVSLDYISQTIYTASDPELNSNDVRHGFVDDNGDCWLSTAGGLSVWRVATGAVDLYTVAGGHLPSDDVVHVFGHNGIIYVCTADAGLVIYDGNNWITHDSTGPNAPNDEPTFLDVDGDGVVFCGFEATTNGVMSVVRRRDSWSVESESTTSEMPDDDITCMAVDGDNNIWIGTAASGLWYYNRNILING